MVLLLGYRSRCTRVRKTVTGSGDTVGVRPAREDTDRANTRTWQSADVGREEVCNDPDNRETDPTVLGNKTPRAGLVTSTHVVGAEWGTGRRKSGRSADTRDSESGTGRTHITGLEMESWFPDNLRAKGDFSVDASTPRTGVNDWP